MIAIIIAIGISAAMVLVLVSRLPGTSICSRKPKARVLVLLGQGSGGRGRGSTQGLDYKKLNCREFHVFWGWAPSCLVSKGGFSPVAIGVGFVIDMEGSLWLSWNASVRV